MFKIIFVLIINAYDGGMTTLDFTTLQQCETAKEQVKKLGKGVSFISAVCIEKQIPLKKTKCKIVNDFSYQNKSKSIQVFKNLDGYPYPVALECVEE
jgi:hypothetical protein